MEIEGGTKTNGRRISIPIINENSTNYVVSGKVTNAGLFGRPSRVFLKFLDLGVNRGWFEPKHIYKMLIWFGFDNDWISDLFLAKIVLEYGYKDKMLKKRESLRILEEDSEKYGR